MLQSVPTVKLPEPLTVCSFPFANTHSFIWNWLPGCSVTDPTAE